MAIATVRIFPSIGIARLGNSPDEFFFGPEIPGVHTPPAGGYKDAHCRVKRQAARFRLYGYDAAGNLVQEITQADATITWTVHLANKKASWREFDGLNDSAALRNLGVANRASLAIDPGARTISVPGQAAGFNTGTFLGKVVPLGEMRMESDGRLLVLGGFGSSESVPPGMPLLDYANNDGWHDDISDGPVTATVLLNGTTVPITAVPAWVICAPPDFAPPLDSITTMYDTMVQVGVDKGWMTVPATPSFTNDVFPILNRVLQLSGASALAGMGHFSFTSAYPPAPQATRQALFARIRNPNNPNGASNANMPKLFDDGNGKYHTITKVQYAVLEKWKNGQFVDDWTGSPAPPATAITPDGLTRAALDACVGAAFFPGIEGSWFLRSSRPSEFNYVEPFRLDQTGRSAGDLTKQMAVPWQADFYECLADPTQGLAWWPAQRPDDVVPAGGGAPVRWTRDLIRDWDAPGNTLEDSHLDMVAHWHQLGFVVAKGAGYEESEREVVCKNLSVVTDRSTFSKDEVAAALTGGSPAAFDGVLYVIAEGFLPAELGITASHPSIAQLAAFAPTVQIRRPDASLVPGVQAIATELLLEDDTLPPALRQRCTFVYRFAFANTQGFMLNGVDVETQTVTAEATKSGFDASGLITLIHQPNPYLLDGATSWLSTDLRVFQITEGDVRFGLTMGSGAADASIFIAGVLQAFNTHGPAGHPFDTISTDQNATRLELSEKVNNKRVFNFAIAQVRYRAQTLDAPAVQTFFRLFTTAATGLEYASSSTYRRSAAADSTALLGLQGGEIVTIPCYAEPRVDTAVVNLATQADPKNVRTLTHGGSQEVHAYFGCWLDFNQTAARFPNHPAPADGPWPSGAKSIQELIRGMHQCLVAEVQFDGDPIAEGATPAASDNLAQRNLAIVESDNPGSLATHTVQHTFEIKATRPVVRAVFDRASPDGGRKVVSVPDELMIRWYDMPRAAEMTLYMPDVEIDELLRIRGQGYEAQPLRRVDAHTLRCAAAGVTYVPIPGGQVKNIAALLTVALPEGVRHGQAFKLVVHQISGFPRRTIGAFQLDVPVSDREALLPGEIRKLAVLRHIARAIPAGDRWQAVFGRYLEQIVERVRGFGGDPDAITAAADGGEVRGETAEPCPPRPGIERGSLCIDIPWHECEIDGELRLRIRFRRK